MGGPGVARGYLPQPALDRRSLPARCVERPPGARLYRTGDRVRARADGALEFLGRRDGQVKIRGHRVELGELEALLGEYGGVAQRVVVRRETPAGDAQLVAYVVAAPSGVTGAAVRTWLQTRVPEALVPAAVVVLDALPLTGNGKVDRAALPAPAAAAPAAIAVAPATALEEIVAGAWAEVLARPAVSVTANFFDLGGHSLLATQLVARLRTLLGVEVPVRAVFETPTVRGLAALVDPTRAAARGVGAPPLTAGPRPAGCRCRLRNSASGSSISSPPARPPITRRAPIGSRAARDRRGDRRGARGGGAARSAADDVAGGRRRARAADRAAAGGPGAGDRSDGAAGAGGRGGRAAVGRGEARAPFDLAHGPLIRVRLLRLGPAVHVLLATLPHVVSDGWSFGVLVRDFTTLYAAAAAGQPSPLPPLPVQYADVAALAARLAAGGGARGAAGLLAHAAGRPAAARAADGSAAGGRGRARARRSCR